MSPRKARSYGLKPTAAETMLAAFGPNPGELVRRWLSPKQAKAPERECA